MQSSVLREQGNALYRNVDDFCDAIKRNRLNKALMLYMEAEDVADTLDDKSSAAKNIALCYWKLVQTSPVNHFTFVEYIRRSAEKFCVAFELGKHRNLAWTNSLIETIHRFNEHSIEFFKNHSSNLHELVHDLCSLAEKFSIEIIKPKLYLNIATVLFNYCVLSLNALNYKDCLYCVRESNFFVEEVLRFGDDDARRDAQILKEDISMQEAIALSAQAREIGDQTLTNALENDESLDLRIVWMAVDYYRSAIIECRELCLESEAHAFSRLSVVYRNVLKCDSRAKECAMRVFSLAKTMEPKNFHAFKWFREAVEILEHIQTEDRLREEAKWENKRKPFVEELKTELSELDGLKTDPRAFLKFVYERFPPTHKPNATLAVDTSTLTDRSVEFKRILKTAMIHYHPDGVNEEDYGVKQKVLCEEIYKVISSYYERTKGISD